MDAELDSELYQQAFQLFVEGFSNVDILGLSKKFTARGITKILQTEIDLVLDEMETAVAATHPFTKDHNYEKRRSRVIRELSEDRRLVFTGSDANGLGETAVRHFLRVCKHYLKEGSLKNYPFEHIYRIFRKWLLRSKDRHREADREEGYMMLQKKKREMEALRIQHEILIKKSKMLELEGEIETLKNNLSHRTDSREEDMEEEDSESQSESPKPEVKRIPSEELVATRIARQAAPPLRPILKPTKREKQVPPQNIKKQPNSGQAKPPLPAKETPILKKEDVHVKTRSNEAEEKPLLKRSSKSQEAKERTYDTERGGLRWQPQETEYFVKLLKSYSIRDQANLEAEMVKKFGRKDRFNVHNIRDKKFEMFRECRRRFLLALKHRRLLSDDQYSQFVVHFETMDNRCAYEFQGKFLSEFYLVKIDDQPTRIMQETVEAVRKQRTRVLTDKYMKKKRMDKEKLDFQEPVASNEPPRKAILKNDPSQVIKIQSDGAMEEEEELSSELKSSSKHPEADSLSPNLKPLNKNDKADFRQQQATL